MFNSTEEHVKRIIAAAAVAAMLTVTGVASAAKEPNVPNSPSKGHIYPCKDRVCTTG
jgi:hypothetical protein